MALLKLPDVRLPRRDPTCPLGLPPELRPAARVLLIRRVGVLRVEELRELGAGLTIPLLPEPDALPEGEGIVVVEFEGHRLEAGWPVDAACSVVVVPLKGDSWFRQSPVVAVVVGVGFIVLLLSYSV